ncbi:MAG TPA: hydantoinase B/oxoprolinase family protein, partial [Polyangiaceae bacterium]|nr:hydantoinase B/oxoprolinase family protein [Polyangiaceae bacterium]
IPPCNVRMGTTLATNALLERRGVPCLLVTTRGFRDVLRIATQARSDLFDLEIEVPETLYASVLEVDARCDRDGNVLARPDPTAVLAELERQRASGLDSVAIVLAHAYRNGELERELGELALRAGFASVALSHEVDPTLGFLARGDTTTLDAYLTPLLQDYLGTLLAELPGSSVRVMQSSGGLVEAPRLRAQNALLSGPAGGVVAVAEIARACGIENAVGFDMGGTSTDVSRVAGELDTVYEREVARVRVRAPMLDIHTVAAGGGSLCRLDGRRLTVGPESAGADPGPLCYGRASAREPTITDMNLLLGRLVPDRFPLPLLPERAREAAHGLAEKLETLGFERTLEEIAAGFVEVANHDMAEAIRKVSVSRGYDVREHALVVFGGAAGQHACGVARLLGMKTLLFHPHGGVLSAFGMGAAPTSWHGSADAGRAPLGPEILAALSPRFEELERRGRASLSADGVNVATARMERRVDLRYAGTETPLTLSLEPAPALRKSFEARHEQLFGYTRPGDELELVAARVVLAARSEHAVPTTTSLRVEPGAPLRTARVWLEGAWREAPVFGRETLGAAQVVCGPALVLDATGTTLLEPGFELSVRADGILVARDRAPTAVRSASDERDPITLEVFGNAFMSIAEQMGRILQKTAQSTNIRERLDFSCAVFDAGGHLIANAPHIPVHLGAMGESVRAVLASHPEMSEGDVFVTNDPARGGSHLPDITVVAPVHDDGGTLAFFVANRGHHVDVGGITPGSMPPFSRSLDEEGVVLRAVRLVHQGELAQADLLTLLAQKPYPARLPEVNLADLRAQIAANREGASLLRSLAHTHGTKVVHAYMAYLQEEADDAVLSAIRSLPRGDSELVDSLDDGTPVRVRLTVKDDGLRIDFTGSGAEHPGNLNAPRAVTLSAVIYFLRVLAGRSIPLNDGILRRVEVVIPEPSLLAPSAGRAVAGGNVETSQRIVDVLLGASGRAAASQGTMNNLSFGSASFGYYETIAGGAGAGPNFPGASGVHTHMTNTRITDVEVLEARYPVRVVEFSLRAHSGGRGTFHGGDGLARELEFLAPVEVSILSERRTTRPFGLAGGEPGSPGRNLVNGREVGGKASLHLQIGDRLRIETPGGGGYGQG